MPLELIIYFTAMTPGLDIKLAIPTGLGLGLTAPTVFLFSVAGSLTSGIALLFLIEPISTYLRKKSKYIDKFFENLFRKTRKQHTKKFERYGALFLILFVAIPMPISGTGSGAIASFIFGVDKWKALGLICIGTLIGGILITTGITSIFAILDLFT